MLLSVVTSVYQLSNLEILDELYKKIEIEFHKNNILDFEIIFVVDEESDVAFDYLLEIKKKNNKIKIINLTRNFGHHEALLTGIEHSNGEYIFVIDSDLEEDPSIFTEFFKKIYGTNIELVIGFQKNRKGGIFEKISGNFAYFYINKILKINYPKNPTTASLMTKKFKNALLLHKEKNINYVGLLKITGFNQELVEVEKKSLSKSSYTFRKKINHLVNISFAYTDASYSLIFYISVINFIFSSIYVLYLVFKYFNNNIIDGYTSLIVSIWFFSSVIILLLGIVSFYLKLILKETKSRPTTIIKEIA